MTPRWLPLLVIAFLVLVFDAECRFLCWLEPTSGICRW